MIPISLIRHNDQTHLNMATQGHGCGDRGEVNTLDLADS